MDDTIKLTMDDTTNCLQRRHHGDVSLSKVETRTEDAHVC